MAAMRQASGVAPVRSAPSGSSGQGSQASGGAAPPEPLAVQRWRFAAHAKQNQGQPGVQRPWPAAVQPVKRRPASNAARVRKQVISGRVKQTRAGLKPHHFLYSEHTGKLVATRRSVVSKAQYKGSALEVWNKSLKEARFRLGIRGRFVPVNGASAEGKRLYEMAKAIHRMRSAE